VRGRATGRQRAAERQGGGTRAGGVQGAGPDEGTIMAKSTGGPIRRALADEAAFSPEAVRSRLRVGR